MSRMSQLHAELSQQAYNLGFENLVEAEQAGYGVDWENAKLIKVEDELDKAHEAWLEERAGVLADLRVLRDDIWEENHDDDMRDALTRTIDFIERGEV